MRHVKVIKRHHGLSEFKYAVTGKESSNRLCTKSLLHNRFGFLCDLCASVSSALKLVMRDI
jgi:hypothetical protein